MLARTPPNPRFGYVLAHGAGAGMRHPFLEAIAQALFERGVATLRYEFAYMEQHKSRPDSPAVAAVRVREAVARAATEWPGLPLVAGGKSFGGRMTSTAQAEQPLPGVTGLAFLGFPLHPPGKPSVSRAEHLYQVQVPMLFLQGTRDEFARLELIAAVCEKLGPRATLQLIDEGDHSFKVPKRAGRTAEQVMAELADRIAGFGRSPAAQ
jgi:predicted alpha/beta-hydrolase family hydrolase